MLDDLRSSYDGDEAPAKPAATAVAPAAPQKRKRPKKILGMTGPQRFAVSVLLMLMVCMLGFMFLLVMGKIGF